VSLFHSAPDMVRQNIQPNEITGADACGLSRLALWALHDALAAQSPRLMLER
jgi:hypothetical protein